MANCQKSDAFPPKIRFMTEQSKPNTIGILLLTHGRLGEALLECARHVMCGQISVQLATLSAGQDEPVDDVETRARQLLTTLDQGAGVLVLTDLLGATPARVATRLIDPGRVEALSGVSLPMLLRAINYGTKPLSEVAQKALLAGTECTLAMNADAPR
jgi:mannose PTS system EIIA component